MTAALKRGRKERLQDSTSCFMVDKPARHHTHIGIVVLAGQTSNFLNPTKGGSYPLMLIQSNVNTIATSTNRHSGIALAFFNGNGQRVSKIGIITTLSRIGSEITIGNAPCRSTRKRQTVSTHSRHGHWPNPPGHRASKYS